MKDYLTRMKEGAKIIIYDWLKIKSKDRLLIVSSNKYRLEAELIKESARNITDNVDIMMVEKSGKQIGVFFDENEDAFKGYNVIVGATDYSLVTTKATKKAIDNKSKFLSLPLTTTNNKSMLGYKFIKMDTKKSKLMAQIIMKYIKNASVIRVTTEKGCDLKFFKRNREAGFFNGVAKDGKGYSSASFEIYVPIEENMTVGKMVVDASLGYIGKPKESITIDIKDGKIVGIEENESGLILKKYIEDFNDYRIYTAGELGIGLNSYSKCSGNCYIEDESAYGTFHIGFGRNIALGGLCEASGHFDLVSFNPNIYADNRKIMEKGRIIVPEPQLY